MGATLDDVRAGSAQLRAALEAAGRDPRPCGCGSAAIVRRRLAATSAGVDAAVDAGATEVSVPWVPSADEPWAS